jgi:hypothetical protein
VEEAIVYSIQNYSCENSIFFAIIVRNSSKNAVTVLIKSGSNNAPTVVVQNSSKNALTTVVQTYSKNAHKLVAKIVISQNSCLR